MHAFTDTQKRQWQLAIDVNTIKALRTSALKIDLLSVFGKDAADNLIVRLSEDAVLLVDLLYLLCQEQAEKAGLTDVDFARSLTGDVLQEAIDAFMDELIDFFPPARRQLLRATWDKARAMQQRVTDAGLKAMASGLVETTVDQTLATLSSSSTSSPASSASTPAP